MIRIESATPSLRHADAAAVARRQNGGINSSGYYNQYNQGKRSLALNFSKPGALEIARRLVAKSDVVVNNFAHGVMDRLGFGYEQLKAIKPDIIMISLSGYGDTGPYSDYVAYGPAQVPLSGLSALTGYRGGPPMHAGFSYADPNAGVHGAFAILTALYHRDTTGGGQYIDMSQWECAMAVLPEGILEYTMNGREPERIGNRDPQMAPHGIFRCLDRPEKVLGFTVDQFVAIAAADDAGMATDGRGDGTARNSLTIRGSQRWRRARPTRTNWNRLSKPGASNVAPRKPRKYSRPRVWRLTWSLITNTYPKRTSTSPSGTILSTCPIPRWA